jgi:hypothetical protein
MSDVALSRNHAPSAVQNYLRFMLGATHLERHEVDARRIRLWFRPDEDYFGGEEVVARIAIGGAFALLCRFGFATVEIHANLHGEPVRLHVDKPEFAAFFGMPEADLDALVKSPDRWDHSPIGLVSDAQQWQFFLKFSQYDP